MALASSVLIAAPPAPIAAATPPPPEYEVKAAFLYHFAPLVDRPPPSAPGEPFVIAVVEDDLFGGTLHEALAGKSVRGQPVRVQRFAGAAEGRVAFDVNLQRAEQSGLRMSSQLLKLARIVGAAR